MRILANGASGSTIKFLTKGMIENIFIFVPDDSILERYNHLNEAIQTKIEILKKSVSNLKEARDRLLPKLMSGELEV